MNDWSGRWGITMLTAALAVTPLRRLTGWNDLVKVRRTLGLFAFTLIAAHFANYLVLDQFFAWEYVLEDIMERPYILLGFTGLCILTALAVTSTRGWIRRLGRGWQRLHSLVYLAAGLGAVHYLWQGKQADTRGAAIYASIIVVLLALRLPPGVRLSARVRARLRGGRVATTGVVRHPAPAGATGRVEPAVRRAARGGSR